MDIPWMIEGVAFVVGLLFGSFLNVCISRLPEHRSIVQPRSQCPGCKETIRWYDNVPLLSWVLLRGRCRRCGMWISWRYPAVELLFGLWTADISQIFWVIFDRTQPHRYHVYMVPPSLDLFMTGTTLLVLGFLLLGLFFMDWETHTLPDAFTLSGTLIGFLLVCVQAAFLPTGVGDVHFDPRGKARLNSPGSFAARGDVFLVGSEAMVLKRVFAIVALAGLLLLIRYLYQRLRGRQGLGLGDVKLVAMLAAFLGFWPAVLAMFLGTVLCSGYAMVLLARRRADGLTRLPLGSFLCLGGLIAALVGAPLIAWYSHLL
jgi:leader peptidase (prepilin peptidase)/N-methyltransferase